MSEIQPGLFRHEFVFHIVQFAIFFARLRLFHVPDICSRRPAVIAQWRFRFPFRFFRDRQIFFRLHFYDYFPYRVACFVFEIEIRKIFVVFFVEHAEIRHFYTFAAPSDDRLRFVEEFAYFVFPARPVYYRRPAAIFLREQRHVITLFERGFFRSEFVRL